MDKFFIDQSKIWKNKENQVKVKFLNREMLKFAEFEQ
jgi:hypothetical protein